MYDAAGVVLADATGVVLADDIAARQPGRGFIVADVPDCGTPNKVMPGFEAFGARPRMLSCRRDGG